MTLMKCGHTTNAVRESDGKEVCIVCIGLGPGADEPETNLPDLTGRKAHCCYGPHRVVPSSLDLPFFEYKPQEAEDVYYCGCWGWD